MPAPRSKSLGPSPGGHLPCTGCLRYGGEWSEPDERGIRWAITAPHGVSVKPGEPWTCRLCKRQTDGGHAMPDDSTDATHA